MVVKLVITLVGLAQDPLLLVLLVVLLLIEFLIQIVVVWPDFMRQVVNVIHVNIPVRHVLVLHMGV